MTKESPNHRALRAAGYKPLPRLWVTQEQLELVIWMASKNLDDINRIRAEVSPRELSKEAQIEKAWAAMRAAARKDEEK